jgi:hypothetical protein
MPQSDFDRAWAEFVDADTEVQPPARLRRSVMAAWDAPESREIPRSPPRRGLVAAGAFAAAVALAVGAAIGWPDRPHQLPYPAGHAEPDGVHASTTAEGAEPAPVVRLVADAALENEPLQVIRVRLPRASLADLGITLVESEVSSLVDVDVVVGSDGLPRAIRHVGPAFDLDRR